MPKITVGDWETRDGRKQTIVAANDKWAIGFDLDGDVLRWTKEGWFNCISLTPSSMDLVDTWREKQTREVWINVYENEYYCYPSREMSNRARDKDDCIACVKATIEFRPGDGLENDL